jgi:hypothetical protein
MALENHIDSLKKRHARLDQMIHEEESHPACDDIRVHKLKSQKVALKDEIARLLSGERIAA